MKRFFIIILLLLASCLKPSTVEKACKRVAVGDTKEQVLDLFSRVVATENSHVSDAGGMMRVVVGWDVRNDATSYTCTMSFDQNNRLTGATYDVSGSF